MSLKQNLIDWEEFNTSEESGSGVNGIFTPLGILQLSSNNTPISQWRIFLGRTNFDMTENEVMVLNEIDGIEMIHVFSRYTFIVAIGSMWNWSEVKIDIEHHLCGTHTNEFQIQKIKDENIRSNVIATKSELAKYNNWAIYVCPNGAITHIESENDTSAYKTKLQTLKEAMIMSSGLLLSSEFK